MTDEQKITDEAVRELEEAEKASAELREHLARARALVEQARRDGAKPETKS